jgi:hypothetical protein
MRAIEFLRSRHVPDLAECGATVNIADDHVRCNVPAVMMVRIDGKEDYVCDTHLTLLCREKWPVQYKDKK